jgi:hypothetical protein
MPGAGHNDGGHHLTPVGPMSQVDPDVLQRAMLEWSFVLDQIDMYTEQLNLYTSLATCEKNDKTKLDNIFKSIA